MTREQARTAITKAYGFEPGDEPWDCWIRVFEALGMVKVDDPAEAFRTEVATSLVNTKVNDTAWLSIKDGYNILKILENHGFKITR